MFRGTELFPQASLSLLWNLLELGVGEGDPEILILRFCASGTRWERAPVPVINRDGSMLS